MNESFGLQILPSKTKEEAVYPQESTAETVDLKPETHLEKREKLKTIKIAVAGPPRNGKTVLLGALSGNLPRKDYFLFPACPDGEGSWLKRNYDDPDVVKLRKKGTLNDNLVGWYADTLANNTMKPIILVDIGGVPSAENARILTEGKIDYGIVLSKNQEEATEWESFLQNSNVEILASLKSDHTGKEDNVLESDGVITGSVHYLERGAEGVVNRPAIHAIAERILHLKDMRVIPDSFPEAEGEVSIWKKFTDDLKNGKLSIEELADILGKEKKVRTLPNGRTVEQIIWEGSDLDKLATLFEAYKQELDDVICLDGAAPAWLVSGISGLIAPRSLILNSPDGFVLTGIREPMGGGEGAEWHTQQIGTTNEMGLGGEDRPIIKSEFALNPSVPLQPKQLWDFAPPEVPESAVVVISGRGPNWLVSSIADSYRDKVAAVACFQPGTGATVVWSREESIPRGSLIQIKI